MSIRSSIRRAYASARWIVKRRQSRREAELELVSESPLFDGEWYLQHYPDVRAAGVDPLRHFMASGWREGRDPGPEFCTSAYLRTNADVARSRSNPLVHFIEHGYSEGRETFGHRPAAMSAPIRAFDFPAPAPCFSSALPPAAGSAWTRHGALREDRPFFYAIGGQAVGYARDADAHCAVQQAFARLAHSSGFGEPGSTFDTLDRVPVDEEPADVWYAGTARLRTRWRGGSFPFVLRAYQADPAADGAVELVGEGLVCSPLDVFDILLINSYFPVLIILLDPAGVIRGSRLLAFPSLCRGGVHYPELLHAAVGDGGRLDPFAQGERLAGRLALIAAGTSAPVVSSLLVELGGADGTSLLFQSDFQRWLERVVRVRVRPCDAEGDSAGQSFLRAAISTSPCFDRQGEGGSLVVRHDMIPTIAVLTEAQGATGGADDQMSLLLLAAHRDPARPVIAIEMPDTILPVEDALCAGVARGPRLRMEGGMSRPSGSPPGAIRISRTRGLADAELLFPVSSSGPVVGSGERDAITWLVEAGEWDEDHLLLALVAAAQQDGAGNDAVAFIGPVLARSIEGAREGFGDRVSSFADLHSAVARGKTGISGRLGAPVILHDHRCASLLSRLLDFDQVATASCLLVSVEPRGKSWHVGVDPVGAMPTRVGGPPTSEDRPRLAEELWRSIYPVAAPPSSFWLARTSRVARWSGGAEREAEGLHLCSSLVTASCSGQAAAAKTALYVPQARDGDAATFRVLFG